MKSFKSNVYVLTLLSLWVCTLLFQSQFLFSGETSIVAWLCIPNAALLFLMYLATKPEEFYWHLIINHDMYDNSTTNFYVDERYYDYNDIIDSSTIHVERIANKDLVIDDRLDNVIISEMLSSELRHIN